MGIESLFNGKILTMTKKTPLSGVRKRRFGDAYLI